MSYFNMNKRLYADKKCSDGVISHGWRYVRKRGVKFAGSWYTNENLKNIPLGEFVQVSMHGYWMTEVMIFRGTVGSTTWFCNAQIVIDKTGEKKDELHSSHSARPV